MSEASPSRDWGAVALPLADLLGPQSVVLAGPEAELLAESLRGIGVLADVLEAQVEGARHDLSILLASADQAEAPHSATTATALARCSDLILLIPLGFAEADEAALAQLLAWFTLLAELGYQPVVDASLGFVGRGAFLVDRAATAGEAELAAFAERLMARGDLQRSSSRIEALQKALNDRADEAGPLREAMASLQAELLTSTARAARAEAALTEARQHAAALEAAIEQASRWDALREWVRRAVAATPETRRRLFRRDRQAAARSLLRASPLFDAAWYIASHPELAASGADPVRHYLEQGAAAGDDPGPWFDSAAYRRDHPKLGREAPLLHAIRTGHAVAILHASGVDSV